jgi:hypothetical protein
LKSKVQREEKINKIHNLKSHPAEDSSIHLVKEKLYQQNLFFLSKWGDSGAGA